MKTSFSFGRLTRSRLKALMRCSEKCLLVLGVASFAYCGVIIVEASLYQARARGYMTRIVQDRDPRERIPAH